MKEIHNDVEVKTKLQPLTGEALRHCPTQPLTLTRMPEQTSRCRSSGLEAVEHFLISGYFTLFRKMESDKKRVYGERIREVEHGSFTPLYFST